MDHCAPPHFPVPTLVSPSVGGTPVVATSLCTTSAMCSVDEAIANLFPDCEKFPGSFGSLSQAYGAGCELSNVFTRASLTSQQLLTPVSSVEAVHGNFQQSSFDLVLSLNSQNDDQVEPHLDMSMLCYTTGNSTTNDPNFVHAIYSPKCGSAKPMPCHPHISTDDSPPAQGPLDYRSDPATQLQGSRTPDDSHEDAVPSQRDGDSAYNNEDMDSSESPPPTNDSDGGAGSAPKYRRKTVPWTKDEHEKFLLGLQKYKKEGAVPPGKNGEPSVGLGPGIAALIAALVGTRTTRQVRSHAQKFFLRQRGQQAAAAAAQASS